jgi:hypothetical protein
MVLSMFRQVIGFRDNEPGEESGPPGREEIASGISLETVFVEINSGTIEEPQFEKLQVHLVIRSPESRYFVQAELQNRVEKQFPGCFLSSRLKNRGKGNACLLTGIDSPRVPAKTDAATVLEAIELKGMAGKPWVLLDASSSKWEGLLRFG